MSSPLTGLEMPACPLCGARARRPYSRQRLAVWWKCRRCGLLFVHPQPADETLAELYRSSYYTPPDPRSEAEREKSERYWAARAAALERFSGPLTAVLDVGCGGGEFVQAGLGRGWEMFGMEVAVDALRALPERLRRRCVVADLEQAPFPEPSFDAVTLFDVIEHVRQPVEFLAHARRLLRPGGSLLISTPNAAVLKARIRGRFWKYLQFERYLHLYHFTPRTIEMALNAAGFEIAGWPAKGMPMILVAVAP